MGQAWTGSSSILAAVDGRDRVHGLLDWQLQQVAGAEFQRAANALMSCCAFEWHPSAFGQCAWGGRALLRVQK